MSAERIGLIDYGAGNLWALQRVLGHLGRDVVMVSEAGSYTGSPILILPGVGSFPFGMAQLQSRGLRDVILKHVGNGKHLLGICLGMQLCMEVGEEQAVTDGLGLVPGRVTKLPSKAGSDPGFKIPHVGWAAVQSLEGAERTSRMQEHEPTYYFVHSYYCEPSDRTTVYGSITFNDVPIPAVIKSGNVIGCQFHPEVSGNDGLDFLTQFLNSVEG